MASPAQIHYGTSFRGTAETEAILRRFTRSNVQPDLQGSCRTRKAIKTLFLCRYLHEETLRREIDEGLNVIEQWNMELPRGLQPFRDFWLNNDAVWQQYDEKHSLHRASKRVRETEKPMWNWTCDKFLSFNYSGLDVVENSYPVCRNFCRFLLAYGLGHILFVSLENVFKFSTILGSVSRYRYRNSSTELAGTASKRVTRTVAR